MRTKFGPKNNVTIVRISALLYSRAEILTMITLLFGPNSGFIKSFQFLLTFTKLHIKLLSDLYAGVNLKGSKKFGSKVINRQYFYRKTGLQGQEEKTQHHSCSTQ